MTRPVEQSAVLVRLLEDRGANAIVAPAIAIEPADSAAIRDAARRLDAGEFDWLVLTSSAGVDALFEVLDRVQPPVRIAAVGDGTARALRTFGVEPDLVPSTFTTDALGQSIPAGSGRVLLARADIAPGELEAVIRSKGWHTERVDAYRTTLARDLPADALDALRAGSADALTFTSASTVRGFVHAARAAGVELDRWPAVVCIGPVTAQAARRAGVQVAAAASPHTIEGLVHAVERVLGHPRGAR